MRRRTPSTSEGAYNTRSQVLWDFMFEWKKGKNSSGRAESATKPANLSTYLKIMRTCKGKRKVKGFVGSS